MKPQLNTILLMILTLWISTNSLSSFTFDNISSIMLNLKDGIEQAQQHAEYNILCRKKQLLHMMKNGSESERNLAEIEYEQLLEREDHLKKQSAEMTKGFIDVIASGSGEYMNYIINKEKHDLELEKMATSEYLKNESLKQSSIAKHKETLKLLGNPKVVKTYAIAAGGALSAIAFSIYASKYGLELAKDIFYSYYKNPTIAQETSLLTFKERLMNKVFGQKIESRSINDVILEKNLEKKIKTLAISIKNTVKNGSYFQNILLYGNPGTGKTMVSKRIARACGLDYIYFAASSLLQLPEEDAIKKITELFEFAKRSSKKLMIIIDEAEKLFAHRRNQSNDKIRNLLTQMLTYTGTESQDYMIIALTNIPDEIDPAFLNRCDEQINITPPSLNERIRIIKKYVKDYLIKPISSTKRTTNNIEALIKYFKKPTPQVKLNIEKDCINDEKIIEIAKLTENFVGRDISKMILSMQAQAFATKNKKLTKDIVNKTVNDKIIQKQKSNEGFKHKNAGI